MNEFPPGGLSSADVMGDPSVSDSEGFFRKIQKDSTWTNSWTMSLTPSATITQDRITFNIPKLDGDNFPFLNDMKVKLRVRLTSPVGGIEQPKDDADIAPINNIGNSMFNNVKLYLNETQVSSSTNGLYPYWAYLNAMVNNNEDRKLGLMQLFGYYEDHYWDNMPTTNVMSGWLRRRNLFGTLTKTGDEVTFKYDGEKIVTVYADIMTEFKGTTVPMLNLVGGRLEIYLNRPGFYIQSGAKNMNDCVADKYYLKIVSAELFVNVKTMNPSLSASLEKHLISTPQVYHTTRMDMRKILIPAGQTSFTTDNIKQTLVSPDRLMLFIVPNHYVDSEYGTSALRMNNYIGTQVKYIPPQGPTPGGNRDQAHKRAYLTGVKLSLNNESLEPSEGGNSADELSRRKCMEFYQNQGMMDAESPVRISPENFADGRFVMLYDLTRSKRAALAGPIRQEAKQGNLKLELTFDKSLPTNSFLMVMSEFHSAVTVDKNRNVMYQYSG